MYKSRFNIKLNLHLKTVDILANVRLFSYTCRVFMHYLIRDETLQTIIHFSVFVVVLG